MKIKTWEELQEKATKLNNEVENMNFEGFSKSLILPSFKYAFSFFKEEIKGIDDNEKIDGNNKGEIFNESNFYDIKSAFNDNIQENFSDFTLNFSNERYMKLVGKMLKEFDLEVDKDGRIKEFVEISNEDEIGNSYLNLCEYYLSNKLEEKSFEIINNFFKLEEEINTNKDKTKEEILNFVEKKTLKELSKNNPNLVEEFEEIKQDIYDKWRFIKEEHIKDGKNETFDFYNRQNQKEFKKCLEKVGLEDMLNNQENYEYYKSGKTLEIFSICERENNCKSGISDLKSYEKTLKDVSKKDKKNEEDFDFAKTNKVKNEKHLLKL